MVFSEIHLDALQEIGNIGLGHAATSLAELLGQRIDMGVPHASFISFEQAIELIGGYEELVACVSLQLGGDAEGRVFYIFNEASTYHLIDMLMGLEEGTTKEMDDFARSTIKEIGNILTGSFISAIGEFTQLRISSSVPIFAFDMLAAIYTSLVIASGVIEESSVLAIETQLFRDDEKVKGYFFLLPGSDFIDKLMEAIGISV